MANDQGQIGPGKMQVGKQDVPGNQEGNCRNNTDHKDNARKKMLLFPCDGISGGKSQN